MKAFTCQYEVSKISCPYWQFFKAVVLQEEFLQSPQQTDVFRELGQPVVAEVQAHKLGAQVSNARWTLLQVQVTVCETKEKACPVTRIGLWPKTDEVS